MVTLHILALCVTFALVLYADEQALQYVRGRIEMFQARTAGFLHYAVALGLASIMITGGLMYARSPQYYLSDPTFIVKMVAVAALIVNSAFIERFSTLAAAVAFTDLSPSERRAFFVSGGVSMFGWGTALLCGLLL
ncbi:MAG TPA: hypothetical protein VMT80_00870 [Candidatus Paceibacterota bacterium]|nr:hypothetical protein [Candidatus Paceibacterota bacterium]